MEIEGAPNLSRSLKMLLFDKKLVQYKNFVAKSLNVTIKATEFPSKHIRTIFSKQRIMNKLIYNLSRNIECDTQNKLYLKLYNIHVIKPKKKVDGLFIRTDYLLDMDDVMKQVEINTISCAFVFWGPVLNIIHKQDDNNTLISDSDDQFVHFLKNIKKHTDGHVALMIDGNVSMDTSNYYEKMLAIKLCEEQGITMYHKSFADIKIFAKFTYKGKDITDEDIKMRLKNKEAFDEPLEMFINDEKVFAVYYRWFYNLDHYSEEDFILRAKLECSTAFSLPSVELQMAGLKIFQVKLTDKSYLKKFISEPEIEEIYPHFGTFKLFAEFEDGDEEDFILKSSQEGGGNNIYDSDIKKYNGDKDNVFLMKKINSPAFNNTFLDGEERKTIPEIGIMGWLLSIDDEIVYNENAGYICRSKDEKSKECGVSCGFGALDSLIKKS